MDPIFQLNGANIRVMAAEYMKLHRDEFLPFLTDADGEMLTDDGFEKYLKTVEAPSADGGVWGGLCKSNTPS